jgi:hypothetical protein
MLGRQRYRLSEAARVLANTLTVLKNDNIQCLLLVPCVSSSEVRQETRVRRRYKKEITTT